MTSTKTKQIATPIVIVLLLFMVVGCTAENQASQAVSQQARSLEKVTIAEFGELFIYAPLYVAQEKGFFQREGLNVTIFPAGGTDKTYAALLSGEAQFGVADPMMAAIAGEKGQPGNVIAGIIRAVPFAGVAKDPSIPAINRPSELGDYVIGTHPAPSTGFTLQTKMFQTGNLEPNIRELTPGTALAALEQGDIDIALELEPAISLAVKNGGHVVYSLSDYYPEFAFTGVMVLPEYANQHPDTAQKLVNAIQKSLTYIHTHPKETADVLTRRFPNVNKDVAEMAVQNLIEKNVWPEDTLVSKAGWDITMQVRMDVGHLKRPALYSDYVISAFSENAKKRN